MSTRDQSANMCAVSLHQTRCPSPHPSAPVAKRPSVSLPCNRPSDLPPLTISDNGKCHTRTHTHTYTHLHTRDNATKKISCAVISVEFGSSICLRRSPSLLPHGQLLADGRAADTDVKQWADVKIWWGRSQRKVPVTWPEVVKAKHASSASCVQKRAGPGIASRQHAASVLRCWTGFF